MPEDDSVDDFVSIEEVEEEDNAGRYTYWRLTFKRNHKTKRTINMGTPDLRELGKAITSLHLPPNPFDSMKSRSRLKE